MIGTMLDSDQIPVLEQYRHSVTVLSTYSDLVPHGGFAAQAQRFMPARIALIDRGLGDPTGRASIVDCEPGAYSVAEAAVWVRQRAAENKPRTVYADRDWMAQVDAELAGVSYWRWYATLDGTLHVAGHAPLVSPAAIQCAGSVMTGVHADFSLVFEPGWLNQFPIG